ncbi:hypothetical protein JCM10212_004996 [Sporobolomyces blumeae]
MALARGTARSVPLHLASSSDQNLALPVQLENLRERLSVQQAIADEATHFLSVVAHGHDEPAQPHELEWRGEVEREQRAALNAVRRLEKEVAELEQAVAAAIPAPLSPMPPPVSAIKNGFAKEAGTPTSAASSDGRTTGTSLAPSDGRPTDSHRLAFDLVRDVLGRLEEMEQVGERIKAMDRVVDALHEHARVRYEVELTDHLESLTSCLSDSTDKDVRAATYRLLRYLVIDAIDVSKLHSHDLHFYLVRTLSRDSKHDLEKEQGLRLVRRMLSFSRLVDEPPRDRSKLVAILRGVVAIAEQTEERLRLAALETLGELVMRDVSLVVECEGLRVVLQAMSDGPHDFSPVLALAFLGIVDHPVKRQWLRPSVDLEIVLSGFTEVQGKGSGIEERVKASALIVETFLKSWSGLIYLNVHGRQALTSLVDSLTNPSRIVRETLLDMFSNIFNVRKEIPTRPPGPPVSRPDEPTPPATTERSRTNLLDQYSAILLLAFVEAGLVEGLAKLASNPQDASTSIRVSALIGEILDLSNRVLPARIAAQLQALPKLFSLTSSFDEMTQERLKASDTLVAIAGLNREKRIVGSQKAAREDRPRLASAEESSQRNLQQRNLVETDRLRLALSVDDVTFRNLLLETGVLSTKDHTRWSFEILLEVVEGPLRNPKRLDESMRASKFMRRVLAFFHPLGFRYSDMRKSEMTAKWTRLGCSVMATLLTHPEGVQYLAEDKLLPQIAECLLQLEPLGVPTNGIPALFSRERIEKTLVSGYFVILGEMMKTLPGLALLDQFKLFTCFYRISELRGREDLVQLIIENADYSREGHARVFLAKAMTSGFKQIRLFATQYLASLIRQATSLSPSSRCAPWQVDLLIPQLFDPVPEVTDLAVSILSTICQDEDTLEMVVQKRPEIEHLGEAAVGLLTQFLASPNGVTYLHEIDFIDRELEDWYEERNYRYMVDLELSLAGALQTDIGVLPLTNFDGTPPPHFYGQLVKTIEGCEILEDSGHFIRFCDLIRQHADLCLEPDYIVQLKSVLWAVGHIGSSENGLMLIEDEFILPDIVEIACASPIYSIRGTAVFALALMSATDEGVEMLEELGWESIVRPLTGPTGLCIPIDLNDLVYTPPWHVPEAPLPESLRLAAPTSHVDREAVLALANLSNHILATKASKQLAKLKARHRSHWASPALFCRAFEMIGSHHYRQSVRKYILDLFDLELGRDNVAKVVAAGEDLRLRKIEQDEDGSTHPSAPLRTPLNGFAPPKWAASGVSAMMNGGLGLEGEVTEDEDESSVDEAKLSIPLKTLTPLLTIRGFLLS